MFHRRGEFMQDVRALPLAGEKEYERIRREQEAVRFLEAYELREAVRSSLAGHRTLGPRQTSEHHVCGLRLEPARPG